LASDPETIEAAIERVLDKDDEGDDEIAAACHYVLGDADGDRRDPPG
jgi:hypothetical protein